ncbi:MAG: DsbA family protein [Myxococcota bacterium]
MRPVRALLFACVSGLFALGASCDDGPADEAGSSKGQGASTGGDAQRVDVDALGVAAVDDMGETDRERYGALVNELLSPCGQPVSLARCVTRGGECAECKPAATYVARLVEEGYEAGAIEERYRNRYGSEAEVELEVDGSPVRGSPMAPVTIVEFSDFECPFCGAGHPILERAVEESDGKVRLVFKHYPLDSHPRARAAARAAIAAGKQDKFWEMHDLLFENQDALEAADLEGYARRLELDLERFREDMRSESTEKRIEKDRLAGREAGVRGTPSIFVNGRLYEESLRHLPAYIEEELAK